MQNPLIIAHRGASIESHENTLPAFQRAIDLQVDAIELDVHLSRDRIPVCHHDAQFFAEGEHRRLMDYTYDEMRALTAGQIPTLEAVLRLNLGDTGLMVELKEGNGPEFSEVVTACFQQFDRDNLVLGSFSIDLMQDLSRFWSWENLIGIADQEDLLAAHMALGPRVIAVSAAVVLLNPKCLKDLQATGVQVWVWTVDDIELGKLLAQAGVDGIITNDPRRMVHQFAVNPPRNV